MFTIRKDFNSMGELIDFVNSPPEYHYEGLSSHSMRDASWDGGADWGETVELARHGWQTGTQQITEQLTKIEKQIATELSGYEWDVQGLTFDVGKVLTGEPECWLEQTEAPKRRFFRLQLNPSSSGLTETHLIINRGAAMVALADLLQSDPANTVELEIARINQTDDFEEGTRHRHEYVLHMGTSPIDLDALAFAIAHPAYNRRLMFAVTERLSGYTYKGGYGYSVNDDKQIISEDADGNRTLYLPRATDGRYYSVKSRKIKHNALSDNMQPFKTVESTAKWVTEVAKELLKA